MASEFAHRVLSDAEMRLLYGEFYEKGAGLKLDRDRVPRDLHELLPYAEFWGIADDAFRVKLLQAAPRGVRDNLFQAVERFVPTLTEWFRTENASRPSREYVAFVDLFQVFNHPDLCR